GQALRGGVDLRGGGGGRKREAEAADGVRHREPHGQEDVGRLPGLGTAGGARAGGDAELVQLQDEVVTTYAADADVDVVGEALAGVAVQPGVRDRGEYRFG